MLRVGVVSDSHGDKKALQRALELLSPVDLILHCGDHFYDMDDLHVECPVEAVGGNCDMGAGPPEKQLHLMRYKVLVTHGHLFDVKRDLLKLWIYAKQVEAQLVVFGHTHVATLEIYDNILFFNPGSVSRPRQKRGATCGLIQLEKDIINTYILDLPGNNI